MKEIRTPRLVLREFREDDFGDLYEFLDQLRDDEFEGYPDLTPEKAREQLRYRMGSEAFYAVEARDTGKVIGNISCMERDFGSREVGFIVNRDFRRRGYALEALRAVIGELFTQGVHRVYAECDPRNEPSWRLLEKAGFRREAHLRQNVFFARDAKGYPVWKDTYVYAVLASEFPRRAPDARVTVSDMTTDEEVRGKAYVHYRTWQDAYEGIVDPGYLASMTLEKCETLAFRMRDGILVAKDGDRVVGFAGYGPYRTDELEDTGEVFAIYVLKEYWGSGVGALLMREALGRLAGYGRAAVWVLKDNARAIRFYERFGFRFDGRQEVLRLGTPVTEVRMILDRRAPSDH